MAGFAGMSEHQSEVRDGRSKELIERLSEIIDEVGKSVELAPAPKSTGVADLDAYFEEVKAMTVQNKNAVALVACTEAFYNAFPTEKEWLRCGVFMVVDGLVHRLTTEDVEFEVASTRVLMNRGRDEVKECSVCYERPMAFACRKCWTSVCRTCFAACTLHSNDHKKWTCPQCRAKGPIRDVVAVMVHARQPVETARAFTVIHRAMVQLGVRTTRVSVEACMMPLGSGVPCGGCEPQLYRRTFKVRAGARGFITIESDESRFLARLMHEKGANIIVGEIMSWREGGLDIDERVAVKRTDGRAFYVGDDGGLIERVDMFECMATYVRSWYS
jgi:hypothetical protein